MPPVPPEDLIARANALIPGSPVDAVDGASLRIVSASAFT